MNDRISDLLDEVADDGGRPLGFTPAEVTARGRGVRRRRTTLAAVTGAAAVAAVAVALAVVVTDERAGVAPDGPAATASDTTSPTPTDPPTASAVGTAQDRQVAERCAAVESSLTAWTLDARATDDDGTTATFVSADRTRWRTCTLGFPGDQVSRPTALRTSWDSPDTIMSRSGVEFAELCPKDSPPDCSRRLYYSAQPLWDGVATVEVTTPQGSRVDAVIGTSTYVVRFAEAGVPESVPVIDATLRDPDGGTVLAFDVNERLR